MDSFAPIPPSTSPLSDQDLESAVDRITGSIRADARTRHIATAYLPDRTVVLQNVEKLNWLLYPGFFGPRDLSEGTLRNHVSSVIHEVGYTLFEQVSRALRYERNIEPGTVASDGRCAECDVRAGQIVTALLAGLSEIRRKLSLDVQAAYDGDPAAKHTDETIFCYPGVRALSIHRLAHELYRMDVPLIARIMSEHAHSVTGIDIHPGARIGRSFFIDHGTGVVIGETTVIGDHCKVYQGVTLGAKSFPKDERGNYMRGVKRHPTLEDHVTVYAGATILGGDTVIGAGSVINGGVFLTSSVPPGHVVRAPKAELTLRSNPEMPPANYAI
jgi:serine O-acetyltransferase